MNIKLKRYIICDDIRLGGISIYEIFDDYFQHTMKNDNNQNIAIAVIARCNNGVVDVNIRNMMIYGNKYEELNIYYQTDNLNDAIDNLIIIDNSKKYNL